MNIASIRAYYYRSPFADPFTISFHTFTHSEVIFLEITTTCGKVGFGEAAPFRPITGDSIEEVKTLLPSLLCSLPGKALSTLTDSIYSLTHTIPSASLRAAIDFALHDIFSQANNISPHQLYTPTPHLTPNSVTVFLKHSIQATIDETNRILMKHPDLSVLKIKLAGVDDLARCRAIREVAPPHLKFVLDANQGYQSGKEAASSLAAIVNCLQQVILIEEPCVKHQYHEVKYIKDASIGALLFADESCCTMADLHDIIASGAFDGINIKLQKAGGISAGRALGEHAGNAGLSIMVGQMFETPLSTAASLACAVSLPQTILTDLDMDLELPPICSGKATFHGGKRIPVSGAGFQFQFNYAVLDELTKSNQAIFEPILSSTS